MVTVTRSAEEFEKFLRCISLLKEECHDVDIRNGMIRQRTNDLSAIFEMDLSSVIPGLDIPLVNLKQKIDLLKCFSEQEVEITVNQRDFTFSDEHSSIRFDSPNLEFMDNKFIPDEEMNSIFTVDESDIILTHSIGKMISDRMKIITSSFNVNNVQVLFENGSAAITTRTQSKDQFAKLVSGIIPNRELEAITNIVSVPFVIDHDGDMVFSMYNVEDTACLNRISTAISDIDINVYCRSTLSSLEEE